MDEILTGYLQSARARLAAENLLLSTLIAKLTLSDTQKNLLEVLSSDLQRAITTLEGSSEGEKPVDLL